MSTQALDVITGHDLDIPAHGPGRALGQKRKPQLRLSMGYRDETRNGAPVKTDHFIPHGDDRAVAKFMQVYGDKPRAVDIRLPGTLEAFLDIQHLAFAKSKSGQSYLRAAGYRNFAADGRLGGSDMLTVFEYGGDELRVIENVPITGVDDPTAADLGVQLQMTVSFGLPAVLGFGGLCQVTSRGKESIDTLWENGVDIYGVLGAFASVALRPKLLLKPSTMLNPKGQKTSLWVLDLYLPESMDEVYDRLERHHELVPARGTAAVAELYGPPREIARGSEESAPVEGRTEPARSQPPVGTGAQPSSDDAADGSLSPPADEPQAVVAAAAGAQGPAPGVGAGPHHEPVEGEVLFEGEEPDSSPFQPPAVVRESAPTLDAGAAAAMRFPGGKHSGKALVDVAQTPGGVEYLRWAATLWRSPPEFVEALRVFVDGLG